MPLFLVYSKILDNSQLYLKLFRNKRSKEKVNSSTYICIHMCIHPYSLEQIDTFMDVESRC